MATTPVTPVVKKAAPVKKQLPKPTPAPVATKKKTAAVLIVDKNSYSTQVSDLLNKGAVIFAVTVSGSVLNSWDIHYYTVR